MILLAIFYGIIAMFAGGVSNALLKGVSTGLGAVPTVILRAGISALTLLAVFTVLRPAVTLNSENLLIALAISVLGYFPSLFFVTALSTGKVGVVAPIASSWIVVAAVIGTLFFQEAISAEKVFVLFTVIAGVVLTSINFKEWRGKGSVASRAVLFAVGAALLWGVVFPLFKIPAEYFGVLFFGLFIESIVCITGIIHLLVTRGNMPPVSHIKKHAVPLFFAGLLVAIFTPVVSLGYLTGETTIVSALAGAGTAVAIFTAAFLYKERLTLQQYAGGACILLGTVFASFI